ncbi:MAG: hypothetical protein FJ096_05605 [Deltaproteobacteria bacterium]|nr:hypothetical protein [Deltaproteobacteria bacterium]
MAPLTAWSLTLLIAACAGEPAHVGLQLRATTGLLADATTVELRVSQGSVCNPSTGAVEEEVDPETFPLDRCGDASWCKTVSLDKDDSTRVFHVLAQKGGSPIAEGCTTATLDKDPLDVSIKVQRFVEPGCCNDGKVQSTEQCDTGIAADTDCAGNPGKNGKNACIGIVLDEVCECDCLAKEIVLSIPGTTPTTTNDTGSKTDLALAFVGTSQHPGALRAVYTDFAGLGGSKDVNIRTLASNFTAITDPPAFAKQLRLPATCAAVLTSGSARDQRNPSIAALSATSAAVAFVDNKAQPQQFNISLSVLGTDGCADGEPVTINADTSSSCDFPDVAGGSGAAALVVWNQGGKLRGRIRSSSGQLVPNADIAIDSMSSSGKPRVAATTQGWVVAYTASSGDNVFLAKIDAAGSVVGAPKRVNIAEDGSQDQPDVASLPSGRYVVVWQSGDRVFFQRYDASGKEVSGDQDAPLSAGAPATSAAAAPALGGGGAWFVAAWVAADGSIWSRIVGESSGFGFNNVNGQNDAFLASHPGIGHTRVGPAVAVGDFVAVGWQDTSTADPHGMIVRRFPLPAQ